MADISVDENYYQPDSKSLFFAGLTARQTLLLLLVNFLTPVAFVGIAVWMGWLELPKAMWHSEAHSEL
jgi:hypothetical protein